jgi:hypothetical protein
MHTLWHNQALIIVRRYTQRYALSDGIHYRFCVLNMDRVTQRPIFHQSDKFSIIKHTAIVFTFLDQWVRCWTLLLQQSLTTCCNRCLGQLEV